MKLQEIINAINNWEWRIENVNDCSFCIETNTESGVSEVYFVPKKYEDTIYENYEEFDCFINELEGDIETIEIFKYNPKKLTNEKLLNEVCNYNYEKPLITIFKNGIEVEEEFREEIKLYIEEMNKIIITKEIGSMLYKTLYENQNSNINDEEFVNIFKKNYDEYFPNNNIDIKIFKKIKTNIFEKSFNEALKVYIREKFKTEEERKNEVLDLNPYIRQRFDLLNFLNIAIKNEKN